MTYPHHGQDQWPPPPVSGQPVGPGQPYLSSPVPAYPPAPQPTVGAIYTGPQPPPADNSKKFLNMSGGVLALVIAGVVLLCCVGPLALCAFGGVLNAAKADPTVTITRCSVKDGGLLRNADIEYTIKNNTGSSSSYSIRFDVLDSSGTKVGDGTDYISDVGGGQTARGDTMIILDAAGGAKCEVGNVS